MENLKECSRCWKDKPIIQFSRDRARPDGRKPWCKDCAAEYERSRVVTPEQRRGYNLRKYNITPDEYEQLFIEQDGKCAICRRPQLEFTRRFAVDHNHETGQIRGLLCTGCNVFLGKIKDSVEVLENAIKYLEK